MRAHVLIVHSDAAMRDTLAASLRGGQDVTTSDSVSAEALRHRPPDLVVLDGTSEAGRALSSALRDDEATWEVPQIALVDESSDEMDTDDCVRTPPSTAELRARVDKQLELAQLRRQWATDLHRIGKELELFSYSVSHDLRTPLQIIDGFAKALREEHAAALAPEASRYLERICSSATRMAALIDGLLDLVRLSRSPVERERVDVSALGRRLLDDLCARDRERKVEIVVEEGLVTTADARLVGIALGHLVDNAWKFSDKAAPARIELGKTIQEGVEAMLVRDNGTGFDMAQADKLFVPFRRLHKPVDYPGIGMGLATVQRIVDRHGGRVWVEAAPGRGATFFFTLGANQGD